MKDHELRVKHLEKGREMVVSKSHYFENQGEYEILEGDAGEQPTKPAFKQPVKPTVKQDVGAESNKADGGAPENKAAAKPKTRKPKVAPPKVSD